MAHYEDIAVLENEEIKCILCKELLMDNNEFIKTHLNSETHRTSYLKRLFLQNNIVLYSDKKYCKICNVYITEQDTLSHTNNTKHQIILNQIKNMVKQDGAYLDLPDYILNRLTAFCYICNKVVEFTFESVKDHLQSIVHRRARSISVQPYNGIFSIDGNDDDLWCKICQVTFDNYIEIIFEHVDEDKEHLARLKKILYLIDGQNITIEKYLTDPNEDKALCRRCNMEVSCNVINLQDHIKGKRHKSS